jgi:lipopolysaccharide exporter
MNSPSLIGKLLGGLRWNAAGFLAQTVFQFVCGIALARILGPLPFGMMAMAWAVIVPLSILADAGLGLALVQGEKVGAQEITFCFWVQSGIGVALALVLCFLSPWIAAFLSTPTLAAVLAALSSVIVIQALGLTSVTLLRRSIDFRRLQIVQLGASVASQLLLALPLAVMGAGVWSLVCGVIANATFVSLGAYGLVRHEVGRAPTLSGVSLSRTSKWYLLLNILNAVQGVMPPIAIGRLFGPGTAGLYDRAYSLVVAPIDRGAQAVSAVLFSFFARTQDHSLGQRDIFLTSLTLAVFFGAPCGATIALHSSLIVGVTLGPKWHSAAELLPMLSVCIPLFLVLETAVPVLNGRGRPDIEVGIVAVMICLFALALSLAHGNVHDVVECVVAVYAFRVACLLFGVRHVIGVRIASMLGAIVPGFVATAVVLAANLLLTAGLPMSLPAPLRLAVIIIASAAALGSLWGAYHAWLPGPALRRTLRAGAP